jgi:hypothetical protein
MSRQLPSNPSLEHLRKQAKDRLGELRAQDAGAKLADAQHALAVEYGFTNWPALKAHVDAHAAVAANAHPITGSWIATPPAGGDSFRSATLRFAIHGDTVTIADIVVDSSGEVRRGENVIRTDGQVHSSGHGYSMAARWLDPRVLEAVVAKDGREVSRVCYGVSADGATLTVSSTAVAHDGYPAADHERVFVRASSRRFPPSPRLRRASPAPGL